MKDRDAFYKKLQSQLDDTTVFPAKYMYKFIVPTTKNQETEIRALFAEKEAVIETKKSKTGKYISVSIVLTLATSKEVIFYYKEAEKIEGIISL